MDTSQKIRDLRRSLNLTQEQVAEKLNVNKATISAYEKGNVDIPTTRIQDLAKVFNVDAAYLLSDSSSKNELLSNNNDKINSEYQTVIDELKKDKAFLQAEIEFYKQIIQSKLFQDAPGNLNFQTGSDKDGRVIAMYPEVATQTAVK